MVKVAGLGSEGPEFQVLLAAELTPGGVDSACLLSEVSEMSTSVLVEGHSISGTAVLQEMVGVVTCLRLCQNRVVNCSDAEVRRGVGIFFPRAGGVCGQSDEIW